jgi:ligand-binding sensor domain-containing protein
VLCVSARIVTPEQLPLKLYTTADGLARDGINRIVRDSQGFLWFATHEGLSRFDGYQFTNYTADQGLPQGSINDLLETRAGDFWIATSDGVAHLNPRGLPQPRVTAGNNSSTVSQNAGSEPLFVTYQPAPDRQSRVINALLEDADGSIWCGTNHGVYRLEFKNRVATFSRIEMGMGSAFSYQTLVESIVRDHQGSWWIGTAVGLYRRWPDGRVEKYGIADGLPGDFINTLLVDSQGSIWVGTRYNGLSRLVSQIQPGRSIVARSYAVQDGLGSDWIASIERQRREHARCDSGKYRHRSRRGARR